MQGGGGGAGGGAGGAVASSGLSTSSSCRHISSMPKPRMEVICVVDLHLQKHHEERKQVLEEVKQACGVMGQHNVQVRSSCFN